MIEINCHSSIKISKEKIIYIDPFKIQKEIHDADIIFITHEHYDHYSPEDIFEIELKVIIIIGRYSFIELFLMYFFILVVAF